MASLTQDEFGTTRSPATNFGQLWDAFRMTSGLLRANLGQTLNRFGANLGRLGANFGQTSGRLRANFESIWGQLWDDSGST